MYHQIEEVFKQIIQYGILVMEAAGMLVLMLTAVKCLWGYFRGQKHQHISLAGGISLAMLFKMGGEVLKTMIVRTWDELAILGVIVIIHAAITFLLHWETKNEKASQDTSPK